jgi:hypothetical protein
MARFAKVTGIAGLVLFAGSGLGVLSATGLVLGAVVLLMAAVAGAVALEERDSVEGLVGHGQPDLVLLAAADDVQAPEPLRAA